MALKGAFGVVELIDRATQPLRSIGKGLEKLGSNSKVANQALSGTQKAIDKISEVQNRLNRMDEGIKRRTKDIGSQTAGVVALGYAFMKGLTPAIEFEKSMKKLEATAFGTADATVPVAENMAKLSKQAKELGASTKFSAIEAADGQLFLAKAGYKTNEILSAMPALLDLASATETDLGIAADITSDLLGSFGMKAEETGRLADVLASASSNANVDLNTLFETLKTAAPIGEATNQSMESVVTATALLGNVGLKGSLAGTALKNAFTNLAAPLSKGSKALEELGINVATATGDMRPLQEIMGDMGEKMKDLSTQKKIELFKDIFGTEAMTGAINLEKAISSGEFESLLKTLNSAEGSTRKMANIMEDSASGSIVAFQSAMESVSIAFGSIFLPAITQATRAITAIVQPIARLIEENATFAKTVGVVGAGILAFKVAALGLTAGLWLLSPALTALKLALFALKAPMVVFNMLMTANPIGLVIAGITALIAAGWLLYNNWGKITDWFKDKLSWFGGAWEWMKELPAVQALIDAGQFLKNSWSSIFDWFKDKLSWFGGAWESVSGAFSSAKSFFGLGDSKEQKGISQNPILQQSTIGSQTQALADAQKINNTANLTVNIEDGQVKSVKSDGNFKTNTFLNQGVQY